MSTIVEESYRSIIDILLGNGWGKSRRDSVNLVIKELKKIFGNTSLKSVNDFLKGREMNNLPYNREENPYIFPLSLAILNHIDIRIIKFLIESDRSILNYDKGALFTPIQLLFQHMNEDEMVIGIVYKLFFKHHHEHFMNDVFFHWFKACLILLVKSGGNIDIEDKTVSNVKGATILNEWMVSPDILRDPEMYGGRGDDYSPDFEPDQFDRLRYKQIWDIFVKYANLGIVKYVDGERIGNALDIARNFRGQVNDDAMEIIQEAYISYGKRKLMAQKVLSKRVDEGVERTIMSYLPYEGYRGGRHKTKKMILKRKHRKTYKKWQ